MEVTTVTAFAGVLGSMVGASATVATAWVTQRTVNRREILQAEVRKREALYGEFIGECARLFMDAFSHSLEKPETLLPVYALMNRIRLCASPPVLAQAERLIEHITDQYFADNLTVAQVWELTRGERADPMLTFGEACRAEFKSMLARI
jgi:hypothetical protein